MLRCESCSVTGTYRPEPTDHQKLLVQLHHEDDHEDDGEDHLTDGHSGVASVQRRRIADEDDEADYLKTIIEEMHTLIQFFFPQCVHVGTLLWLLAGPPNKWASTWGQNIFFWEYRNHISSEAHL